MTSELRQNRVTKEWVLIAPTRGSRPSDLPRFRAVRPVLPPYDPDCPFCRGNEHQLPPLIAEWSAPAGEPWQVRVVWNKYPDLTPDAPSARSPRGIYMQMPGYGYHEIVIESPHHHGDLADMPSFAVQMVLRAYRERYLALREDARNVLITIFRNRGAGAGASMAHPHSQIVATGVVPHHIRWQEDEAQRYFDESGHCVYCDMITFELEDRQRVVLETPSFLAFIPYAAEVPYETWIIPKRHQPDFGHVTEVELAELSLALQWVLQAFRRALDDPDYNYVLITSSRRANDQHLHWYLRIRPRLVTRAGFEIGSGIRVNPSLPEHDAARLREAGGR